MIQVNKETFLFLLAVLLSALVLSLGYLFRQEGIGGWGALITFFTVAEIKKSGSVKKALSGPYRFTKAISALLLLILLLIVLLIVVLGIASWLSSLPATAIIIILLILILLKK